MDNLFDFRGRGCLLIQNFYRVVVVVVVARADKLCRHTHTRSFICLVAFRSKDTTNPRRKVFFYSSLVRSRTRERIIITDTYVVDITKER